MNISKKVFSICAAFVVQMSIASGVEEESNSTTDHAGTYVTVYYVGKAPKLREFKVVPYYYSGSPCNLKSFDFTLEKGNYTLKNKSLGKFKFPPKKYVRIELLDGHPLMSALASTTYQACNFLHIHPQYRKGSYYSVKGEWSLTKIEIASSTVFTPYYKNSDGK